MLWASFGIKFRSRHSLCSSNNCSWKVSKFHRKALVSESFLTKFQAPRNGTLLQRDSNTVFSSEICEVFKNTLFCWPSPVAASDSFKFPACNFVKNESPAKMFFYKFCKISKNTFSFDRTPPDDCFLCLSLNFEKFFRTLIL